MACTRSVTDVELYAEIMMTGAEFSAHVDVECGVFGTSAGYLALGLREERSEGALVGVVS